MTSAATPGRIVVTGAAGFVAGHLVPRLRLAFPASTLVLCGAGEGALDITDHDAVEALVRRERPGAWVHLAAISAVPAARDDPQRAWSVNLHGALAVGRALLAHAPECLLLFVSSAEVYGRSFASGQPLDETAALAPMNTYAATKAAADLALGAMVTDGLRLIRARPFNHTGPGQSADFVIPAFARQLARIAAGRQAPVMTVGALDPARDFLDVRDVCDAYVACLVRPGALANGAILNIASGQARRIGDVLDTLMTLAGVTARIEGSSALHRRSEIPIACGNAARARDELAWSPAIAWERTLSDVLADWDRRIAGSSPEEAPF